MKVNSKYIIITLILITIFIISCKIKEEIPIEDTNNLETDKMKEAEKVAERFARYWEQKDFSAMYDMIIPELKEKRNKEDFIKFFLASETATNIVIRLDKISSDIKNISYAYYTVSSSIYDSKAPAIQLIYIDNRWYINAFEKFFTEPCAENCDTFTCKETLCSRETGFKCAYKTIDSCQQKLCIQHEDCNLPINQTDVDECESNGIRYYIKQYCSDNSCKFICGESAYGPQFTNPTMEEAAKLKLKVSRFDEPISIKNNDQNLTKVTIRINQIYKKEIENIESDDTILVNRSEFRGDDGSKLGRSQEISRIYLYSQQGKWWNQL